MHLKVSISGKKYGYITVHEHDEPELLASKFAAENNLTSESKKNLEKLIEDQIDIIVERDIANIKAKYNRSKTPIIPINHQPHLMRCYNKKNRTHGLIDNKDSDVVFKYRKDERYKIIFNMLGPGRDCKISFGTIKPIGTKVLFFQILRPLIDDIRAHKMVLNFNDFSLLMDNFLHKLSFDEKSIILNSNYKSC